MKINIKYTNLDSTPAMNEYVEEKVNSLYKLLGKFDVEGAVQADVEIARTSMHHHKGPVYRAEINLRLPGKFLRAEHEDWDARIAVDETRDKLKREIIKFKETHV